MKISTLLIALICGTLVTAAAQISNRFPAPLGTDRILSGVIEKAQPSTRGPNARPSRFHLKSGEIDYALHGQESKLKKFVGRQVRITGHVVGNDVDVQSVSLTTTKD
jgi:hypothetical protein